MMTTGEFVIRSAELEIVANPIDCKFCRQTKPCADETPFCLCKIRNSCPEENVQRAESRCVFQTAYYRLRVDWKSGRSIDWKDAAFTRRKRFLFHS